MRCKSWMKGLSCRLGRCVVGLGLFDLDSPWFASNSCVYSLPMFALEISRYKVHKMKYRRNHS